MKRSFHWMRQSRWQTRVLDALVRCAIAFCIALILEAVLLHMLKMLWSVYQSTAVGQYYVEQFPERAVPIQRIAELNLFALGWRATVFAFLTCLCLGCFGQLSGFRRYVYDPRGFFGRLIYGFLPATTASAWLIEATLPESFWAASLLLVSVPTLCVLSSSFALAKILLPELAELPEKVREISTLKTNWRLRLHKTVRQWKDKR